MCSVQGVWRPAQHVLSAGRVAPRVHKQKGRGLTHWHHLVLVCANLRATCMRLDSTPAALNNPGARHVCGTLQLCG